MEFLYSTILTLYKYFHWKPNILLHLRGKFLYQIVMNTKAESNSTIEKYKYFNRIDKAFGLLLLAISPTFCFCVNTCTISNEAWTALNNLFGKHDEMQAHILDNELNSLDLNKFENIQDFFAKFKSFLRQL